MRTWVKLGMAGGALLCATIGWAGYLQLSGNVHEVIPGVLYRSAQLDAGQLGDVIRENGIRAVLNLRGGNPAEDWYKGEVGITDALGVSHADLAISARSIPTDAQMGELIALIDTLPRPLLIHCLGGADRTGLASAIFLAREGGYSEAQVEQQLSFRYGHVSLPGTQAWPMNQTWERLEASLGYGHS